MTNRFESWIWPLLLVLMLPGCKQRPLICEAEAYFELGDGGSEYLIAVRYPDAGFTDTPTAAARIASQPTHLTFQSTGPVVADWNSWGHVWSHMELTYSPAEGKARDVLSKRDGGDVPTLVMRTEGKEQWVRFSFSSPLCEINEKDPNMNCAPPEKGKSLVADMRCRRQVSRNFLSD